VSIDHDRLFELLPSFYRFRDAEVGEPLRALLQVIAEQVDVVQRDIDGLYANWFIETCDDWIVPYIGDLVGELPNFALGSLAPSELPAAQRRLQVASPRRQVAGAIARRRRKGTPAILEELAADVAGWPARVVESYALLLVSQALNHLHLDRGRTVDMRDVAALERLDGPFDTQAHALDVRRIGSRHRRSRWNIPAVALFAWRLRPYSHEQVQAYCIDRARHRYTFSVLGNDVPLMTRPTPETSPSHIAAETNVPAFITRLALHERGPELYGPGRSVRIWRDGRDHAIPVRQVVSADLSAWAYRPRHDEVAVDPQLGRMAFSPRNAPEHGVWVTYHEGFPDDLGGGEYLRSLAPAGGRCRYSVGIGGDYERLMDAVAAFQKDRKAGRTSAGALIEILDGEVYQERITIELESGDRLEVRAAEGVRPVLRLLDLYANRPDQMRVSGARSCDEPTPDVPCPAPPPQLVLDGLLITGRSVEVTGPVGEVVIRHCTLVPGWSLEHDCDPAHESEPSIELVNTTARLRIEHSIVGSILVNADEVSTDPLRIAVLDSVLDATDREIDALGAPDGLHAHALLHAVRTTVIGRVRTHAIELGENAVFYGLVHVARRQLGCLRYCSVEPGSRTPRRHRCQPDLARAAARELADREGLPPDEREALIARETARVRPQFDSTRYGSPTYARLALIGPAEIARGADDGSAMGVYHDLFELQRADALQRALDDFTPAGMAAGILFAT
jgi:hypothetical protein